MPEVQAWAFLDPDHALAQARAADELAASGRRIGPLHGVPVGVKDIIDTADMPTENGSVLHAGRTPARDATVVARLRAAGAVIMGKTVTTEFAAYAPGQDAQPAQPRAHARRLLQRLGGRGGGRHGAARARQPDQRLRDPARRLLRRLRLQAHPRPDPAPRRVPALAHARHVGRVRPHASRTSRCWPSSWSGSTSAIPTRGPGRASRSARWRPRSRRSRRSSRFVKTSRWDARRRDTARGVRGAGGAPRRPRGRGRAVPSATRRSSGIAPSWKPRWRRTSTASGRRGGTACPLAPGAARARARGARPRLPAGAGPHRRRSPTACRALRAALRRHPHPGRARHRAAGLESTGDPSFCTLWTLSGMPALTCRSCRGERPAHRRPAGRPPPRRRPAAPHRPLARPPRRGQLTGSDFAI